MIKNIILAMGCIFSLSMLAQKVGIGTTNPNAQLHVISPTGSTSPILKVEMKGIPTPFLIVTPTGNIGINVSNPSEVLEVSGNIQFSGSLMPAGNAGAAGQVLVSQGPGTPPQWQSIGGAGGVAGLCNSTSANYLQKWTGTELCNSLIFDDGSNVGIGTNSPTSFLTVIDTHTTQIIGTHLQKVVADPSTTWATSVYGNIDVTLTTDNTIPLYGGTFIGRAFPDAGLTYSGSVYGITGQAINEGDGTLQKAVGVHAAVKVLGAGSIIKGYGVLSRCQDAQTCYGLYVAAEDPDVDTAYGVFVADEDKNFFSNNVGIATQNPLYKLHVAGDAYVKDSLRLDGDFRPAGNPGSAGQVLVSQGPGNPPQWQTFSGGITFLIPPPKIYGPVSGGQGTINLSSWIPPTAQMVLLQVKGSCRIFNFGGSSYCVAAHVDFFSFSSNSYIYRVGAFSNASTSTVSGLFGGQIWVEVDSSQNIQATISADNVEIYLLAYY